MKIIGLTGGIGSGKTTVSRLFHLLGVPIYIADERAKKLFTNNPEVQKKVIDQFGSESIKNGEVNRSYLANITFNNKEKLTQLNAIIHPAVAKDFSAWVSNQTAEYVIKEAAILFESGSDATCDKVIVVVAPDETRIDRVMQRDELNKEAVMARMRNQWSQEKKIEFSDFVIINDNSVSVIEQVTRIHKELTNENN